MGSNFFTKLAKAKSPTDGKQNSNLEVAPPSKLLTQLTPFTQFTLFTLLALRTMLTMLSLFSRLSLFMLLRLLTLLRLLRLLSLLTLFPTLLLFTQLSLLHCSNSVYTITYMPPYIATCLERSADMAIWLYGFWSKILCDG